MRVETLLPLGKLDPGLRAPEEALDLEAVPAGARQVESLGYSGLVVEETKDDPFQVMALAAHATSTLRLGTSVAIAFPRSPTVTAMAAWSLQKLSRGRFTLGLGSQVRGHIVRRYGVEWTAPGPWMREYLQALRAIWRCWQSGEPLSHRGERYQLDLMVPLFDPGPIDHPDIPVQLAAVNPMMCRVAGEIAEGLRPHPVCSPRYIEEVMLPAVRLGAERERRDLRDFAVAMKPLVATGPTGDILEERIHTARARIAFYVSTPAYRAAFELHGFHDLADEMRELSRAQRWEEMPERVSDDVLHTYVAVGTYDEIAARLRERYADTCTHIEFSIPVRDASDAETLRRIIEEVEAP